MTYVAKKGRDALKSMTEEKKDFSKVLVPLKSGTSYKVRIPSAEDFVEYYAHSVFKKFYTTPCTKASGKPDLYDQAVDILYKDANAAAKAGDEKKAEELREQARLLKAKPRYLFGFFNLADGEEIIVDLTKAQARVVVAAIEKYAKKIDKLAFELSKEGSGTSTQVSLTPIIDEDDLSETERKNFEATSGKTFDESLYENVLKVKDESEQLEDLRNFGFDVSRLDIEDEVEPIEEEGDEEDYGF